MKKITALALFLMMTGSHAAFAAPAPAAAGVAASLSAGFVELGVEVSDGCLTLPNWRITISGGRYKRISERTM